MVSRTHRYYNKLCKKPSYPILSPFVNCLVIECTLSDNLCGDNTYSLACHYLDGRQNLSIYILRNYENTTLQDTDNTDNH